jgi:hypothetical protein
MVAIGIVVLALILIGLGFVGLYRPWHFKWGATGKEVEGSMPGDEIVPRPTFNATRAITIGARPEAIWPWIVQIGFGRAGWYSYDFLDNMGRDSAEHIVPELQHIEVGDLVPLGPGENSGMRVKEFVPNRWIVWWDEKNQLTTWVWALDPLLDGNTRLVTRVRSRSSRSHPTSAIWLLLVELADFPMMRKCLLGIKRRAETRTSGRVSSAE